LEPLTVAGATAYIVASAVEASRDGTAVWENIVALTEGVHDAMCGKTFEEQLQAANERITGLEAQLARLEMAIQGLTSSRR
jgi:bacterioferritin (cytochrome b1)